MTDNKQLIRATYTNEAYGDIRTIYNLETDEVLFCARDVAKAFGYADPSRSVRDICVSLIKEAHITDGGLQVLNFIRRYDVIRLFKHSRSENSYDFLFFLESVADDFAEKVFDRYIDEDDEDEDDDFIDYHYPEECNGDFESCPIYDECDEAFEYGECDGDCKNCPLSDDYDDDEYDEDETSEEFKKFLEEHTTKPDYYALLSVFVDELIDKTYKAYGDNSMPFDSILFLKDGVINYGVKGVIKTNA